MNATPEQVHTARLHMGDMGSDQYLDDATIAQYIEITGNPMLGAADALDAIAISETLVGKVIRTQDLQTDGTKVADSLRKAADRLRARVAQLDAAADAFAFDVATPTPRRRPEGVERFEAWGL